MSKVKDAIALYEVYQALKLESTSQPLDDDELGAAQKAIDLARRLLVELDNISTEGFKLRDQLRELMELASQFRATRALNMLDLIQEMWWRQNDWRYKAPELKGAYPDFGDLI